MHDVLESIEIMADACRSFDQRCAQGIEPNFARIEEHLNSSLTLATALTPHIGYEKAAQISLAAHREGLVTAEQFDEWIRPEEMARPRPDR